MSASEEVEVMVDSPSEESIRNNDSDERFFDAFRTSATTKENLIKMAVERLVTVRSSWRLEVSSLKAAGRALTETNEERKNTNNLLRERVEQLERDLDVEQKLNEELLQNQRSSEASTTLRGGVQANNTVEDDRKDQERLNRSYPMDPIHRPDDANSSANDIGGAKLPPPEVFDGKDGRLVTDWLVRMERYLDTVGAKRKKWVQVTTNMLTGLASGWWQSVIKVEPGKFIEEYTWEEFVKLITDRFVPVNVQIVAMARLMNSRQTSTVSAYVQHFQSLNQTIEEQWLPERTRVLLFSFGLREEIQALIALLKPDTLQEIIGLAMQYEGRRQMSQSRMFTPITNRYNSNRVRVAEIAGGSRQDPIYVNNAEIMESSGARAMIELEEDRSEYDLNQIGTRRGFCHFCGEPGHWRPDCPKLRLIDRRRRVQQETEANRTGQRRPLLYQSSQPSGQSKN